MRLESPFLFRESFSGHSPAHFVLVWAQSSRGACSQSGVAQGDTVLGTGYGEHIALVVQEVQMGQDTLAEASLWCNESWS